MRQLFVRILLFLGIFASLAGSGQAASAGGAIGFPPDATGLTAFVSLVGKTAPALSCAERERLVRWIVPAKREG